MDNLIKKYEYDMLRHERKLRKMKEFEAQGKAYDLDDIKLSDDEAEEFDFLERRSDEKMREKGLY